MKVLEEYLEKNSVITNKKGLEIGIGRHTLSALANEGKIERIRPGLYQKVGEIFDDFILLSGESQRVVFSHQTALYLHDLSDRVPIIIHISVPQGYNASHLKERYQKLKVHYVGMNLHDLGITTIKTPLGNTVLVYDLERTIIDIIRNRKKIDKQIFIDGITGYFRRSDKNLRKLISYSKKFKIEGEVRRYMEVLLWKILKVWRRK